MSGPFDLLLAGAGHAHLGVLRLWRGGKKRPPGRIALINDGPFAWYSGMLPGLLAGRYHPEECRVPLQRLCEDADIELVIGRLVGLEPTINCLVLDDSRRMSATCLSLNLGSLPQKLPMAQGDMALLQVKPFAAFIEGWHMWQRDPQPLAIVGGGAAGVELALALAPQVPELTLLSTGQILKGHPSALRRRALSHLAEAGVAVREGPAIDAAVNGVLVADNTVVWKGTRAILATGATPLPWLSQAELAVDERGFIRIGNTLQSLSNPRIFASGDCASLPGTPRNGVYAVRQGPTLAANLRAALSDQPFQRFVPQRHTLALLADGREGALMSWSGLTAEGWLLGRWKDRLDHSFINRHRSIRSRVRA